MAFVESTSYTHYNSLPRPKYTGYPATRYIDSGTAIDESNALRPRFDPVDLPSEFDGMHIDGIEAFETLAGLDPFGLRIKESFSHLKQGYPCPPITFINLDDSALAEQENTAVPRGPFHRWMRSLHRRAAPRHATWVDESHGYLPAMPSSTPFSSLTRRLRHRTSSSSESSLRFITTVRSASISLASVSAITRPRRNVLRSSRLSRTERSSRTSFTAPRVSQDSFGLDRPFSVDAAAIGRALQRRRILEELISTEEGYIGDVRFLINVYISILASLPSLPALLRSSINRNLNDIVELHDEILGELHRIIPHAEYTQPDVPASTDSSSTADRSYSLGHRRWRSLDIVPEHPHELRWLQEAPGMLADAQVGAEVARIFGKRMNRFFIYKEYGAKYETMIKDIGSANRSMPEWESYQKGLEALASTLGSVRTNGGKAKKALTIGDLLVKPIQRVCKYPLLFAELLKFTPVFDCPNSHMEVDNTLTRLREATAEINRATNDVDMRVVLEKTWLLQDRLVFPDRKFNAAMRSQVRAFGLIELCGSLHVCWQTETGVEGQYMVCLLYRDVLCLAEAGRVEPIYTIMASIDLSSVRIENADNGRGLQCHTAPFSWKLLFECDCQLYEIIMSACSYKEEAEWRARLCRPRSQHQTSKDSTVHTSLDLEMKSLGTVYGKHGSVARRQSIQRATTVGPKSAMFQVVLRNTSTVRDYRRDSPAQLIINRSPSLMTTTTRLPVLSPARAERARVESLLVDVWSRDVLPFPGMTTRSRSEQLMRNSASTMMRKLSVASITGSFSKRSGNSNRYLQANGDELMGIVGKPDVSNSSEDTKIPESWTKEPDFTRESKKPRLMDHQDEPVKPEFEIINTSGTVRKRHPVDIVESCRDKYGTEMLEELPISKTSSVTSAHLSSSFRSSGSEQSIAWMLEKENKAKTSQPKVSASHRWGRPSLSKMDGKGHGLWSFFR